MEDLINSFIEDLLIYLKGEKLDQSQVDYWSQYFKDRLTERNDRPRA